MTSKSIEKAGVRTKLGDRVLIVNFDLQKNECMITDSALSSIKTVSRSSIVDSDDAIVECHSITQKYLSSGMAKKLRKAHEATQPYAVFAGLRGGIG